MVLFFREKNDFFENLKFLKSFYENKIPFLILKKKSSTCFKKFFFDKINEDEEFRNIKQNFTNEEWSLITFDYFKDEEKLKKFLNENEKFIPSLFIKKYEILLAVSNVIKIENGKLIKKKILFNDEKRFYDLRRKYYLGDKLDDNFYYNYFISSQLHYKNIFEEQIDKENDDLIVKYIDLKTKIKILEEDVASGNDGGLFYKIYEFISETIIKKGFEKFKNITKFIEKTFIDFTPNWLFIGGLFFLNYTTFQFLNNVPTFFLRTFGIETIRLFLKQNLWYSRVGLSFTFYFMLIYMILTIFEYGTLFTLKKSNTLRNFLRRILTFIGMIGKKLEEKKVTLKDIENKDKNGSIFKLLKRKYKNREKMEKMKKKYEEDMRLDDEFISFYNALNNKEKKEFGKKLVNSLNIE